MRLRAIPTLSTVRPVPRAYGFDRFAFRVARMEQIVLPPPQLFEAELQGAAPGVQRGHQLDGRIGQGVDQSLVEHVPIAVRVAPEGEHLKSSHAAGPGAKVAAVDILVGLAPEHQIDFLQHVVGRRRIAQQHQDERIEPRLTVRQLLNEAFGGGLCGHNVGTNHAGRDEQDIAERIGRST